MFNVHSIQSRLVFYLLAVMGGVFLVQILYLSPRFEKDVLQNAREIQEATLSQIADGLDATFQSGISELEAMAALPDIRSLDRERMHRALRVLNASNHFFNYYFVMDRAGRWLSYPTHPELVGESIPRKNMGWVERTFSENRTVFMDVVKARIGPLVSGFSTPIRGDDGEPIALLRGVILVSEENALLRYIREAKVGKTGFALLLSSNGHILAHPRKSLEAQGLHQLHPQDHILANAALKGQSGSATRSYAGHPWMIAYRPVPTTGWAVFVKQPMEDILAAARREARLTAVIYVASFFLGLLLAVLVVKRSLRPLGTLVRQIRNGRLDTASKVYPKDEIGQLARQYDELYASLYASREQLRQSEMKFRTLFDNTSDGLVIHDLEGRILEVNPLACEQRGYTREELLHMTVADLDAQEHRDRIQDRIQGIQERGHLLFETAHVTKNGTTIPVEVSARPIEFEGKPAILGILRDLTERKEAERALRESEEKYRLLVEASPFGVVLTDDCSTIEYVNPRFTELFGYDLQDIPTTEAWFHLAYPDPAYRSQVLSVWEQDLSPERRNHTSHRVFTVCCKDGSSKEVHFRLVHLQRGGLLIFLEDITHQKRLEKQFYQAQKMEAVGTLAGGIAHDFNNLLMGIQGRISMILPSKELAPSLREHLQGVEEYVRSASDLTHQLLGVAQGGKFEVQPLDLNRLVQKSADMFARTRKEIRVHQKLGEGPLGVEGDSGQLEQVLLNLYVNAWQAMPAGGDLYIETRAVRLDESQVEPYGLDPGDYVRISVTDTGVGMDKSVQERIFDPFFTTKGMGRGTGLGLASAYGIIKNHSGFIHVYSEKGKGTTFSIYLPASHRAINEASPRDTRVRVGSGRILLVDDETMILEVGTHMLESLGYEVIPASGGEAALQIYRERSGEIDLVILDMVMPDLSGGETFDQLKAIHPDVRVLLSSGYSINGKATEILNRGCRGFLQKPFNLEALSNKVAAVLED